MVAWIRQQVRFDTKNQNKCLDVFTFHIKDVTVGVLRCDIHLQIYYAHNLHLCNHERPRTPCFIPHRLIHILCCDCVEESTYPRELSFLVGILLLLVPPLLLGESPIDRSIGMSYHDFDGRNTR